MGSASINEVVSHVSFMNDGGRRGCLWIAECDCGWEISSGTTVTDSNFENCTVPIIAAGDNALIARNTVHHPHSVAQSL